MCVAVVRGVPHRYFQHAGDGRNPDENWHGASFPYAARAVGLPSLDHEHNYGDEPVHSTEVEPRATFCLRNAYLGLGSALVATLERLIDFDRINTNRMRLTVAAVASYQKAQRCGARPCAGLGLPPAPHPPARPKPPLPQCAKA